MQPKIVRELQNIYDSPLLCSVEGASGIVAKVDIIIPDSDSNHLVGVSISAVIKLGS